jgi:hypothetical protein
MKALLIYLILFLINTHYKTLSISLRLKAAKLNDTDPLAGLSDEELFKLMKEYNIDTKEVGSLVGDKLSDKSSKKKSHKKDSLNDININMFDDPLKSLVEDDKKNMNSLAIVSINEIYNKNKEIIRHFDLTHEKLIKLIQAATNYKIFSHLPIPAMNILNDAVNKESYQKYSNRRNKTEEMNILISNTLNSKTFIDNENKVCRKGMLTLIDINGKVLNTWSVLNNKVFTFYDSKNYQNIIKIYRVAMIKIKDLLYSPCFFIFYENSEIDFNNSQCLVCALNFRDKEYWLNTLFYHKEQYKILLTDKSEFQSP